MLRRRSLRSLGRSKAHDVAYAACYSALEHRTTLIEELRKRKRDEITAHLDDDSLSRLVDPANYIGSAPLMVDRVIGTRT